MTSISKEIVQVSQWVICFAIATPLIQRNLLWPLARKSIPVASKCSSKQEQKEIVKGMGKDNNRLRQRSPPHSLGPTLLKSSHSDLSSLEQNSPASMEEEEEKEKQLKFVVAGTKMLSYMFYLIFAAWALRGEWYWFFDPTVQHLPFPTGLPSPIAQLYRMEIAHYLYTLVSMFFEPRMKDRPQMIAHHIFTLTLLITSRAWDAAKYGTVIMVLHDFSDPWMEAAKLFNYAGITIGANLCFSIFAVSFLWLRVWVFPRHIIWATFVYCRPSGYPHYWVTFTSLVGLWVLHCIWSTMILRVFIDNVIHKKKTGDPREEDN